MACASFQISWSIRTGSLFFSYVLTIIETLPTRVIEMANGLFFVYEKSEDTNLPYSKISKAFNQFTSQTKLNSYFELIR